MLTADRSTEGGNTWLLVVNPVSGRQNHEARIARTLAWFGRQGQVLQLVRTSQPGEARELVRKALESGPVLRGVIAAGGDGTINEVVNALAGSGTPLGILPWGTANVFAMEMGFPRQLRTQCRLMLKGPPVALDVGRCNGRAFLLMAGFGFDAYALRHAGIFKKELGPLAYVLGVFRSFVNYRSPRIWYNSPGGRAREAAFLLVSNTSLYGGIFRLSPRAHPADGLLDVYAYREKGRWRLLKLMLSLALSAVHPEHRYRRRMLYLRDCRFQTRDLRIWSDQPVYIQLDGDFCDALPAQVGIDPGALQVFLPTRARRRALMHRESPHG